MKNIKIIILLLFISNNFAFSNTTYADWNIEDLNGMVVLLKYSDDKLGMFTLGISKVMGNNIQILSLAIEENTIIDILYNNGTSKRYDLSENFNPGSVIIMGYRANSLINDLYNAHTVKLYVNNRLVHTFQLKNLTQLLNKYK